MLPPMPGMGEGVMEAVTEFLRRPRTGRPRGPSRLADIEKAISEVRASGKRATKEAVAGQLRVDPKTLGRWLRGGGRTWAEVADPRG
jgi:hypothetical protein